MKTFMRFLYCRMFLFFVVFWRRICVFLFGNYSQGEFMQSGELVVVGHDKVDINLGHRPPSRVFVHFLNDIINVPCNPKHHDELRYQIKNHHHHHPHDNRHDHCKHESNYMLTIHWHVTGVRVIRWVVYY